MKVFFSLWMLQLLAHFSCLIVHAQNDTTAVNGSAANSTVASPAAATDAPVNSTAAVTASPVVSGNDTTSITATTPPGGDSANGTTAANGDNATITTGTIGPKPACYDNYTQINEEMKAAAPFQQKIFILCPNFLASIGENTGGETGDSDSDHPLEIRSHTTIQCGEDGKASNNCTFYGGVIQMLSAPIIYKEPVTEVKIIGVTFQSAAITGIIIASEGVIEFIDCTWKDHSNSGALTLWYDPQYGRRQMAEMHALGDVPNDPVKAYLIERTVRAMKEHEAAAARAGQAEVDYSLIDRNLQDEDKRCLVVLTNCNFTGNSLPPQPPEGTSQYGVIMVHEKYHDLVMNGAIFEGNKFNDSERATEGFAVLVEEGNKFFLENTCILENDFLGPGSIILNGTDVEVGENNYVSPNDALNCLFIYDLVTKKCTNATGTCDSCGACDDEPAKSAGLIQSPLSRVTMFLGALMIALL